MNCLPCRCSFQACSSPCMPWDGVVLIITVLWVLLMHIFFYRRTFGWIIWKKINIKTSINVYDSHDRCVIKSRSHSIGTEILIANSRINTLICLSSHLTFIVLYLVIYIERERNITKLNTKQEHYVKFMYKSKRRHVILSNF